MIGEGGLEFEEEIAKELRLERIVGSGNKWHSKLDLKGILARWSLKFTSKKSFVVTQSLIDEAVDACEGPGGDGSTPVWLIRIGSRKYDMILLRKIDFLQMQTEEVIYTGDTTTKSDLKRAKAAVPQLLRENNEFSS